ncbi:glycosyltransferase [Gordonia sp. VNQ95]|jgi:galactofuranosylgalactofuranosylrhamnosyl-N-acetylglucosaminyl-diphospho-decaprenol beta-1,5/1,6-galactofuranosyltransferase|uniref:glycosyltransferase n=1 Tax=Gordonia sp. VNQ95 TaxID=3156619 RepID=UPI0032B4C517
MHNDDLMVVQRTVFAGPNSRVNPGMYVDADIAAVRTERTEVRMDAGVTLSTNTYFGRFAASYWQRYSAITEVRLEFDHEVADDAILRFEVHASDASGRDRPVEIIEITGTGRVCLDLAVRRFVDGGAIWFDATAIGGGARLANVTWSAPRPERVRPISVVICTHNRPSEATATALALASEDVVHNKIAAVYLVDQGTDRVDSHADFERIKAALGDKLHYLTQPNLGGAGGFNRGLFELTRGGVCDTDVLLMDDDILAEPESLLRLSTFAASTVEPMLVGSQMLLLSETYRVHMTSEWDRLGRYKAGMKGAYSRNGINALEKQQEIRVDAGYNAWWSCLIPAEAAVSLGLSLPMFFQWDDVEYGIRARRQGFGTVTLPNSGVWHADFHLKDYDDWSRYFSWRNAFIVAALHGRVDPREAVTVSLREIGRQISCMEYGLAATFILALRDFLVGPSVLADGGQGKLAELAELRSHYPETKVRPAAEVGREIRSPIVARPPEPQKGKLDRVLLKRAVKQSVGRVIPGPVSMAKLDATWWHVALFSWVVVTDGSQTGVRVRRRDADTLRRLTRELAEVCWELYRRGPEVASQWRDAAPALSSRENWQRLFDGD